MDYFKHYDLSAVEEFNGLYGSVYKYKMEEIYNKVKALKWPNIEIERLFKEIIDECEKQMIDMDDYFDITTTNIYVKSAKLMLIKIKNE